MYPKADQQNTVDKINCWVGWIVERVNFGSESIYLDTSQSIVIIVVINSDS